MGWPTRWGITLASLCAFDCCDDSALAFPADSNMGNGIRPQILVLLYAGVIATARW
jgi:hypothetical protein